MKRVIIFRGLPGSGKSTQAKALGGVVLSTDDYFMVDGVYCFDASKIGAAHIDCMRSFLAELNAGRKLVVVDNTNTRLFELTPYQLVAQAYGYEVDVVRVVCSAAKAHARNTHGVPFETVMQMAAGFQDMPAFLGGETLVNT